MCEPTLILSVASGAMSAITGIQEQNRQWSAQAAAIDRQNRIAKQDYLNKTTIAAFNDQRKLDVFEAQNEAAAREKEAYYKQQEINQIEKDRASAAAQLEMSEKVSEAQMKGQEKLAEQIKAQGTVLAGETAGQSMLLEAMQTERDLGFAEAGIDESLWYSEQQYAMKEYDIALSKFSADSQNLRGLKGGPTLAPQASWMTTKPIMAKRPKKPSALGPILGGITAGFSTYIGTSGFRGGGAGLDKVTEGGFKYTSKIDPTFGHEIRTFT